jgi:hypothetical protein
MRLPPSMMGNEGHYWNAWLRYVIGDLRRMMAHRNTATRPTEVEVLFGMDALRVVGPGMWKLQDHDGIPVRLPEEPLIGGEEWARSFVMVVLRGVDPSGDQVRCSRTAKVGDVMADGYHFVRTAVRQ